MVEDIIDWANMLQRLLNDSHSLITKAVDNGEYITATIDYSAFLQCFNRYWLEDHIADWFDEHFQCEDYDVEVGFEDNICFVTPKELEII